MGDIENLNKSEYSLLVTLSDNDAKFSTTIELKFYLTDSNNFPVFEVKI